VSFQTLNPNRWLSVSLLIACVAGAQTSQDTVGALDDIVVTGTKTEKRIEMTPVKTEVVGKEDIEKFAACNLYQVLDGTPGIRMEQQCNNCNFSLMRMNGLEGGYAKVLIDGMPVYSGLAGVYGMQQIQAGLIERIEIVKGAGSALYGSDAIAGVVNVITKKPGPVPSMTIGGSTGFNPVDDKTKEGNVPLSSSVNFSATHRKDNFAAIIAGQSNTSQEIDNNADMATDRVNSKNLGGTTQLFWYDVLGDKSTIGLMGRAIYENRKGGSIEQDAKGNYYMDNALSPEGPGSEHIVTERFEGGLSIDKELPSRTLLKGMLNVVSHARSATNGAAWEKIDSLGATQIQDALSDPADVDYSKLAALSPQPFLTNERTIVGEINAAQPIGDIGNTILAGAQVKRTDVEENINGDGWVKR
jgi:outer membrane receptor for ferrienterochelin and colicins